MENMSDYRVEDWVDDDGLLRALPSLFVSVKVAAARVLSGVAVILATTSGTNANAAADASASALHVQAAMRAASGGVVTDSMRRLSEVSKRVERGIAALNDPDESDIDPDLLAAVAANLATRV